MKRCVECKDTLPYPTQTPICPECFEKMLKEKIEEEESEKVGN